MKDRTNTTIKKTPVYENDGNVDALVQDARPRRGRQHKGTQDAEEFVMAGGLGQAGSEDQTAPLSEQRLTTDDLLGSDAPPPPTAKANRRPPRMTRKAVRSEAQSKVSEDVKKRMQATARKEAAPKKNGTLAASEDAAPSSNALPGRTLTARRSNKSAAERSEFSLSPSPPPPGKLNSVKRSSLAQPGSAIRSGGTPGVENSILALKNFKRRPRQPSMLQMVQQRIGSARPSAVNMQATEDPSVFDVEGVDDDEEEFAPEAEGTPLHKSKAKQQLEEKSKKPSNKKKKATDAAEPVNMSKKRKSDELDNSSSALDALKAKRQKSAGPETEEEPLAAFRKSQSARRSSSERQVTPEPQITSDVQVINSSPSTTPPTEPSSTARRGESPDLEIAIPSTEKQQDDVQYIPLNDLAADLEQDIPNGTMAEPASSSPLPSEPPQVSATQQTDIMADPLTQISPPRPKQLKETRKKSKPLNTATLQALLPKRRQPQKPRHRKSEYDIDSDSDADDGSPLDTSHLEENEDELSGRLRRHAKSTAPLKSKEGASTKTKSRQSKAAPSNRKSSAAPPNRKSTAPSSRKKNSPKTYGRNAAATSDKENEGYESPNENDDSVLPETSISMVEAAQSEEIEQAKKKFAELDTWEMEFESMSYEEGRSSSQTWR